MNKILFCLVLFAHCKLSAQENYFAKLISSYGVKGNGSDDYKALQRAIDSALAHGETELFLPSGTYNISQGLLFTNRNGKFLNKVHFFGNNTTIHLTNPKTFAVGLQLVKGFRCENINVTGMNTDLLSYSQKQILDDSSTTFLTKGVSNRQSSPHAGFAVDPIGSPALKTVGYEGFDYKYESKAGSTDIVFRNCTARYFAVDYAISSNGTTQNSECIRIVDCWGDYAKVAISTGQAQNRSIYVENFKCWGATETVFDCRSYGDNTGCPPEVNGLNVAGGVKYLCNLGRWVSKGLIIHNAHMESLWSLGGCKDGWSNKLAIYDSWINLAGKIKDIDPPSIVFRGEKLIISNSSLFQYGADKASPLVVNASNAYFDNVLFDYVPTNIYATNITSFVNCNAEGKSFGNNLQIGGAGPTQLHNSSYLWMGNMQCFYPNKNPLVRTRVPGSKNFEYFIPQLILGDITAGSKTIKNVVVEGGDGFVTGVPVYIPYFPDGTKIVSYKNGTITMSAAATISINNAAVLSGNWSGVESGTMDANSTYLIGYKVGDKIMNNRPDLFPGVAGWICTKNGITGTSRLPEFKLMDH